MEPTTPAAFDWSMLVTPAIVVLVPLLVLFIKKLIPPKAYIALPVIAAALGPGLDYLSTWLTAQAPSPGFGVAAGLAGVGLREFVDQGRQLIGPTALKGIGKPKDRPPRRRHRRKRPLESVKGGVTP